ncbi:MAG: acetoacetate--CoA ligase, partial [Thermoleophilaceae bacterium]
VAAFLATASLGAIWSSAAPEFGARAVIDRFRQIKPKVLLVIDFYRYGGKDFDCSDKIGRIHAEMPDAQLVRFGYGDGSGWPTGFARDAELVFEPVEFSDPLWILYSSGTTGLPKPIVHSQGGILVEQLKNMYLQFDARPGDRVFAFSTTGWMIWNFLVGVLLTDASIVLFDGSPAGEVLWDLAADSGTTTFCASAAFIAAAMKQGIEPAKGRDLSRLQAVGSGGSRLSPESFEWVYDKLGEHIWLAEGSGGTDVCTGFVGGVPTLRVYPGEMQARALGVKVESWDERGRPHVNQVGELVVTEPMPSMPIYFWGDESGERLRESYFSMWPGVWRHGDWIEITDRDTAIIYGRSDTTINRGGVRMGTSEIYRAVLSLGEVQDALVVDVPRAGEENWMPLFVVMKDVAELDDDTVKAIRTKIREDCSPRHVPDDVIQIPEVPRTLSGKVLEVPVKRILQGDAPEKAASRESLANPEAFDWFVEYAIRVPLAGGRA